jgi:hypothetical protein
MRKISLLFYFLIITIIISSGKFSCNVGALDVKLNKAYLVFENGERVPDGNIVDFTSPVNLVPLIDSGWTSKNAKVMLGASEKISSEDNAVILNEEDLFSAFPEGLTEEDAGIIGITASISLPKGAPPATFDVYFKVWDKNPGWIYKR